MIFYKNFILFTFIILLNYGCSSLPNNIAGNFRDAFDAIGAGIFGFDDYPITKEMVDAIPYASLRMKIGKGSAGLLILESVEKKSYTWVSADNVFIVVNKNGRIIETAGLTNNLKESLTTKLEDSFFENPVILDSFVKTTRFISLDNPPVNNLTLEVSLRFIGTEEVVILGQNKELQLVEEQIENKYIRWKFTNKFWLDPETGFVWKSIQQIAPNIPPVLYEVTKKPAL
tara:strand:+ start:162 stop:848 length:687 start_codon:yes stop_codon:yes gene_type:complete